jgi:HAD superfamily hydrolase (TIGR01509 family)
LAESTSLGFVAELPGDARGEWTVGLDQAAPTPVEVEGTVERTGVRLFAAVAVVAAGLFLLVLALAALRGRHRRRTARSRRGKRDEWIEGAAPDPVKAPAPPVADRGPRQLQIVVTAAHGVLWEDRATAEEWLVNLVAMQGGTATRDEVIGVRREAMVGRIGSSDLWRALGVPGDPAHLDAAYVARFSLAAGVDDLVTALARRGIGIACLTDDVLEWSHLLRNRFGLDRTISPWIVSAEVGAVKPGAAAFDELLRRTGVPFEHCLYIDDQIGNLDVAKGLGMATVLVAPTPGDAPARGHGQVVDLGDLLRRRAGRAPAR